MNNGQNIPVARGGSPAALLSPEQKRFNSLIKRIERAREQLSAWQQAIPPFRKDYTEQVLPLLAREQEAQRNWLLALDRVSTERNWSRADAKTLAGLIYEQALHQLEERADDSAVLAVFERIAGQDYASHQREAAALTKEMFEAAAGVDLGDEPFASEEAVFERFEEHMRPKADDAPEGAADELDWHAQHAARAGTASRSRAAAREQKRQAEAARVGQSVRDIYRKLVSELHPDREPDLERRLTKTSLMQKVNVAYEQNDLLTLLETQLQLQQLDAAALNTLNRATLKRYNSVLADQLQALEHALELEEVRFVGEYGIGHHERLEPQRFAVLLALTCKRIRASTARLAEQREWLRDPALTRGLLKAVRDEERAWQRNLRGRQNDPFDDLF